MDRYCGPCRNRARCSTHPHALDDRREDLGARRVVALLVVLVGVPFLVALAWALSWYVRAVASAA